MPKRTISAISLSLILIGMLNVTFNAQSVGASDTIYIRADGSIDPTTAPIQRNGDLYTLTDNISTATYGIVIERNNITLDGAGHTLQGSGAYTGIDLSGRENLTIRNTQIKDYYEGIFLSSSSNSTIEGNNIANNNYGFYVQSSSNNSINANTIENNSFGIYLGYSSNNSISRNSLTANDGAGIWLFQSINNTISRNNIANNHYGVNLSFSSNHNNVSENTFFNGGLSVWDSYENIVVNNLVNSRPLVYLEGIADSAVDDAGQVILVNCNSILVENLNLSNTDFGVQLWETNNVKIIGNTIADNYFGILLYSSPNNIIYHNNFINNIQQVRFLPSSSANVWNDSYPSGGNYWSDYIGVDEKSGPNQDQPGSDDIGDTPYFIDANNQDNYPLMKPFRGLHNIGITRITTSKNVVEQGYNLSINAEIVNYGIYTENLNITFYANTTIINQTQITLTRRNSTTITFTWNTSSFAKGNYTIWAYAWPLKNETDISDNRCPSACIPVTILGDVAEPYFEVDIYDVTAICICYDSKVGPPRDPLYCPDCDLDGNGIIDIFDVTTACINYGQKYLPH